MAGYLRCLSEFNVMTIDRWRNRNAAQPGALLMQKSLTA
jgi:hypothetical protein